MKCSRCARCVVAACFGGGFLFCQSYGIADDFDWVGVGPTDNWFDPLNWLDGEFNPGVPGPFDSATVDTGGTAEILFLGAAAQSIALGDSVLGLGGHIEMFDATDLIASTFAVGVQNDGSMLQHGGSVTAAFLKVGDGLFGNGMYTMSDPSILATSDTYIGIDGNGSFVQIGGAHGILGALGELKLGVNAGSDGRYALRGGTLDVRTVNVGQGGFGRVDQTGGKLACELLRSGAENGARGEYALSGGQLELDSWLFIAFDPGSEGEFELSGSGTLTLEDQDLHVGHEGVGLFRQSGGTLDVGGDFVVATQTDSDGTAEQSGGMATVHSSAEIGHTGMGNYSMSGGTLEIGDDLVLSINGASSGSFQHTGGTVQIADELNFRSNYASYTLDGTAELFATTESIATGNGADFFHLDGSNTVSSQLCIGCDGSASTGAYFISDGTLTTTELSISRGVFAGTGLFCIEGSLARVEIADLFYVGAKGRFSAVPGSVIHMLGADFENLSTIPGNVIGLDKSTFVFEGGDQKISHFEVASRDLGPTLDGFTENFSMSSMRVGGDDVALVQLVNSRDNQPGWSGDESLYVRRLIVGPRSTLDLNGRTVYFRWSTIDPTATIIRRGGKLVRVRRTLDNADADK